MNLRKFDPFHNVEGYEWYLGHDGADAYGTPDFWRAAG